MREKYCLIYSYNKYTDSLKLWGIADTLKDAKRMYKNSVRYKSELTDYMVTEFQVDRIRDEVLYINGIVSEESIINLFKELRKIREELKDEK